MLEVVVLVVFKFHASQRCPELTGQLLVLLVPELDDVDVVLLQLLDTLVVEVLMLLVLGFQFSQPCGSAAATLTEAAR